MRTMLIVAMLCVPTLAQSQDGAPEKVKKLVEQFSDPEIDVREAAMRALIELGDPAVDALKKAMASEESEVRERAVHALTEIRRQAKLKTLYPDRKRFDLQCADMAVEDVLRLISTKTGVRFQPEKSVALREKISVTLANVTLMQALDAVCREAREMNWSLLAPDLIQLRALAFIPTPSCYIDGFRVSLRRLETYRCSNFQDANGALSLFLSAAVEPGIQISGSPGFSVLRIVDETKQELESFVSGSPLPNTDFFPKDFQGEMDSHPFAFKNLARFARKLSKIEGKVSFCFALDHIEITLDDVRTNSNVTVGGLAVQVNDCFNGSVHIMLTRAGDMQVSPRLFDLLSITVIDADGAAHNPLPASDIQNWYRVGNTASFMVWYNRTSPSAAKTIKLKVIKDFYEKTIPFEFTNVPLP